MLFVYAQYILNGIRSIRYIGFDPTDDGGRSLGFIITTTDLDKLEVAVDVPAVYFSGADRILIQEAVPICSLKVKELCELGSVRDTPRISLTAEDIGRYRQVDELPGWQTKRFSEGGG